MSKFVIYDGASRPSKKAQPFPGDRRHHSDFSLKSGSGAHEVGNLAAIQARSGTCPFCYLVAKSVEEPTVSTDPNSEVPNHVSPEQANPDLPNREALCYAIWEIDGRDNPLLGSQARTRRLHLYWDDKYFKDSYLVFVAPQRLFDFNSDSQGSWEREAFFLGRELRTDGNNQVLMKSWLDQCCQHHGDSCAGDQSPEFVEMATQSYFGVIDVLDMCLKSLPRRLEKSSQKGSPSRYAARIRLSGDDGMSVVEVKRYPG